MWQGCSHLQKLKTAKQFVPVVKQLHRRVAQHHQGRPAESRCLICLDQVQDTCKEPGHAIVVEIDTLHLWCSECGDYIHDYEYDAARCFIVSSLQRQGLGSHDNVVLSEPSGLRGIVNLGNTCFMNSILQILVRIPAIRDYFLLGAHRRSCNVSRMSTKVVQALAKDGISMNKTKGSASGKCFAELYANCWTRSWGDSEIPASRKNSGKPPKKKKSKVAQLKETHELRNIAASIPVCFGCEFEYIVGEMYCGEAPFGKPLVVSHLLHSFWVHSPLLAGYLQQDAHEFFNTFANSIHAHTFEAQEQVKLPIKPGLHSSGTHEQFDDSREHGCSCIVHQNFGGIQESEVVCSKCGNASKSFEPFFDISLNMSRISSWKRKADGGGGTLSPREASVVTLNEMIEHYVAKELMQGTDKLVCSTCNSKQEGFKRLHLKNLPPVLCFQLKRFKYKASVGRYEKDDTLVTFPLDGMDMRAYTSQRCRKSEEHGDRCTCFVYDLFAIVSHRGSLESGHYVAHIKLADSWYTFDDEKISRISSESISAVEGYLLFYNQQDQGT